MNRSKPMRRTAWKRKPAPDAAERAAFVERILRERCICEAGTMIGSVLPTQSFTVAVPMGDPVIRRWHGCDGTPVDVHEILTRGRGGDPLDPTNVLAVCRACHEFIHRHPRKALAAGLLKSGHRTNTK